MKAVLTILIVSLLAGCVGELEMFADSEGTVVSFPGTEVDENGEIVTSGERSSDGETTPLRPGFSIEKNEVRLLPFHIRLQKLSVVTGLDSNDPLFEEVRRNRHDLGDHNYAQGIGPDLSWDATKMSLWVRSIQPICNSEAMATRYPYLPEHLNELLTAAYGREATADDLAIYDDVIASVELDEAERYEAVCIAVLTSSEFVAQ